MNNSTMKYSQGNYSQSNQSVANRMNENTGAQKGVLPRAVEAMLGFLDLLIALLLDGKVRKTLRVCGAVICFIAFLFVIAAVESGSLMFESGILASALLFGIAFLCVFRKP